MLRKLFNALFRRKQKKQATPQAAVRGHHFTGSRRGGSDVTEDPLSPLNPLSVNSPMNIASYSDTSGSRCDSSYGGYSSSSSYDSGSSSCDSSSSSSSD